MPGTGDSQRIGGVHIDLTLQGAEKVKADAAQAGEAVKSELNPAIQQTAKDTDRANDALDQFSKNGLAGMLLKLAALRKAMQEVGDLLQNFYEMSKSGGDIASHIFSEQGLAGAEAKMRQIADQAERSSSAVYQAGEILKKIASLDVSGIANMFTEPAKLLEEQNRLAILAGKQMREDRKRAQDEETAAAGKRAFEEGQREEERRQKELDHEEELSRRQIEREKEQRERDKKHADEMAKRQQEAAEKAAEAFADRLRNALENIGKQINSGPFGASQASGDMSQIVDVLQQINVNTRQP